MEGSSHSTKTSLLPARLPSRVGPARTDGPVEGDPQHRSRCLKFDHMQGQPFGASDCDATRSRTEQTRPAASPAMPPLGCEWSICTSEHLDDISNRPARMTTLTGPPLGATSTHLQQQIAMRRPFASALCPRCPFGVCCTWLDLVGSSRGVRHVALRLPAWW